MQPAQRMTSQAFCSGKTRLSRSTAESRFYQCQRSPFRWLQTSEAVADCQSVVEPH